MAKKKHLEQVPSLEDFVAPWETEAGEVEIDKDKLKRYIYNLTKDKAGAQDARDEALEAVTEAEAKVTEAQEKLAEADSTGQVGELQKKLDKAVAERDEAVTAKLRVEVAVEKGLTPKQAARLQGSTKEELEADADDILETFGVQKSTTDGDDEDDDEDEDDSPSLRSQPQRLRNPADPDQGAGGEIDFDKVVAGFNTRVI